MTETRTYWLSFCDVEKPKSQQFLGVCIVDVTAEEAAEQVVKLTVKFGRAPNPDAEWIAAAMTKAWALHCNPGGTMLSADITGDNYPVPLIKDRLLSYRELVEAKLIDSYEGMVDREIKRQGR